MAEKSDEPMLEILRRLQIGMAALKEGRRTANLQLAAIESRMAGFRPTVSAHTD